jgi:histidinol phosphatase-like enzyme
MNKLAVFDKDWTLVKPKSGGTFVQAPEDQELLPGVAEKLEELRSDGWCLAIASNQGGCAKFEVAAKDLKPGMVLYHGGMSRKICKVLGYLDQHRQITLNDGDILTFLPHADVEVSYKTIEDAIAEMGFALQLTGIEAGFFCPDMEGAKLYLAFPDGSGGNATGYYPHDFRGQYRKPGQGMLLAIQRYTGIRNLEDCLMVGDREEDQRSAQSAGFAFEWAKDFLGGAMLKFEVGRIYRLRDLDNNAVWDSRCVYAIPSLVGDYVMWTMENKDGLQNCVSSDDNVKVEAEYDDWPEPFPQYLSKDSSRFVDGIKTHHMIPLEEREKADLGRVGSGGGNA